MTSQLSRCPHFLCFFVFHFLKSIVICGLCVIHVRKDSVSNVYLMVTRPIWIFLSVKTVKLDHWINRSILWSIAWLFVDRSNVSVDICPFCWKYNYVLTVKRYLWRMGDDSIKIYHLTSIGNPIVEIRRSYDRLVSTMGFPIPVRWHLYIESGPMVRH